MLGKSILIIIGIGTGAFVWENYGHTSATPMHQSEMLIDLLWKRKPSRSSTIIIEAMPKATVGPRKASPRYSPVPNEVVRFVLVLAIVRGERV
jgi:hypothetical protein